MTDRIVTTPATAVKAAATLHSEWLDAAESVTTAFAAFVAANYSSSTLQAYATALDEAQATYDAWQQAEADEAPMWAALCAEHDAECDLEWPEDWGDPGTTCYTLTPAGMRYQANRSTLVNDDSESPYGDGTTGWLQPAPVPSYYQGTTPDVDTRDRLEKLAW